MKINIRFELANIDTVKFRRDLHGSFSEVIAKMAFSWLNATSSIIPVWSGASKGTFLRLARQLGFGLSISPVVKSRVGMGDSESNGYIHASATSGVFEFYYSTTLKHLIVNEYTDATAYGFHLRNPGPYKFQLAGEDAVKRVTQFARVPEFKFKKKILTVR